MSEARWKDFTVADYVKSDIMTTKELSSKFPSPQPPNRSRWSEHDTEGSSNEVSTRTTLPTETNLDSDELAKAEQVDAEHEIGEEDTVRGSFGALLKSFNFAANTPHTEVHLVVPKFNKYGVDSVLSLVDSHSALGTLEFMLHSRSAPGSASESGWNLVRQSFCTAMPKNDIPEKGEMKGDPSVPSTFPKNAEHRLASHLTKLMEKYEANRTKFRPESRVCDTLPSENPNVGLAFVAKDLLKSLNKQIAKEGRQPSWYHWPVSFGEVPTVKSYELNSITDIGY